MHNYLLKKSENNIKYFGRKLRLLLLEMVSKTVLNGSVWTHISRTRYFPNIRFSQKVQEQFKTYFTLNITVRFFTKVQKPGLGPNMTPFCPEMRKSNFSGKTGSQFCKKCATKRANELAYGETAMNLQFPSAKAGYQKAYFTTFWENRITFESIV